MKLLFKFSTLIVIIVLSCLISDYGVSAHGYLIKPAGRPSAWRVGYKTPINYNDMEMWCGGLTIKRANNGRCGICGDPYNGTRASEVPDGKWVTKPPTLTGDYGQGDWINVTVNLTAAHKGYFVFRLCPSQSDEIEVTQECLNQHPLEILINSSIPEKRYKYYLGNQSPNLYNFTLKLPANLTCSRCVLQWDYTCGNQGTTDMENETFRACADIRITNKLLSKNSETINENQLNNSTESTIKPNPSKESNNLFPSTTINNYKDIDPAENEIEINQLI